MRKKFYKGIFLFIVLPAILFSCATSGVYERSSDATNEFTTYSENGVTVILRYLDKRALFRHFGNRNNPFVNHTTGTLIVVETTVQSLSDTPLRMDNIVLGSEGGLRAPLPKSDLLRLWEYRLRKRTMDSASVQYHNWSRKYVLNLLETRVVSEPIDIEPQSEISGLLLMRSFPRERGEAKLELPVYDMEGTLVYEFTFTFQL
jgi:hypothetical protein